MSSRPATKLFALFLALLSSLTFAEEFIPGTRVSYSAKRDTMTDSNRSIVFLDEMNDTASSTYLSLVCAGENQWVFALATKHQLVSADMSNLDELDDWMDSSYTVSYRVGNNQPATVKDLGPGVRGGQLRRESFLIFDANANNAMAQGLQDGYKVAIRIEANSSAAPVKQTLDYVFLAKGFAQAFKAVNYCR